MLKCNINTIVYFNYKSDFVQKGFKGFSNIINQSKFKFVLDSVFAFESRSSGWRMISLSGPVRRVSRYA